jgi:hypothetical protein
VRLEDILEGLLQTRLALRRLRSAPAGAADTLGMAAGPPRRRATVFAHRLKLANPGVDGPPAHAQHLGHIGNPTTTDLQRLDRRIAAPVILRQGGAVQPHGVFVLLIVTVKLAHQATN